MWQEFWGRNVILSDYVELNPRVSLPRDATVPFVSMDVISPGTRKVLPAQERQVSGSGSKFLPGDTLFARITPCLENGKIAQYAGDRPGMGSTEFFVLRAKKGVSDAGFVYYFSQTRELRMAAEKSMSGASGRQRALISSLSDFECEFPPLPIQRRIAGILSAYDELIENSQRRIKILESMARALYREWFVHFRFPGHEKHTRVASPLGDIPQGWEVKPVESFCPLVSRGVTPKYETGSNRFIINQKVNRGSVLSLDDLKELEQLLEVPGDKFARFGDVLVNCLGEGTIGRVHFYAEQHQDWAVDQHMSICRAAKPSDSLYVYFALESPEGQGRIASLKTGGTNMTMFNISALRSFALVTPPAILMARFADLALPMIRQRQALTELSRNLRLSRDLLLPRLLSGQIEIGNN